MFSIQMVTVFRSSSSNLTMCKWFSLTRLTTLIKLAAEFQKIEFGNTMEIRLPTLWYPETFIILTFWWLVLKWSGRSIIQSYAHRLILKPEYYIVGSHLVFGPLEYRTFVSSIQISFEYLLPYFGPFEYWICKLFRLSLYLLLALTRT